MSFFKTVLALLLLVVAGARLGAQCGTISFVNPLVVSGNVTFEVWYNNPPTNITSVDLYVGLGSATFISATPAPSFTATFSSGLGVRIRRTTAFTTSMSFKLCDIVFSLPLNQTTTINLSAGSVSRSNPQGTCFPSNLGSPSLSYTMPSVTISGNVQRIPGSNPMNNVTVKVIPVSGIFKTGLTYTAGTYSILMAPSASFTATASRDDASSQCGIAEYDMTLTQRVILNLATFSQPYELIAADVTRNSFVSTSDLVKMQQVILGQSSFVQEWEFVPYSHYNGIAMPSVPQQVPTYSTIMQINQSLNTFYGIKYGDVDASGNNCAITSFSSKEGSKMFRLGKAQVQNDKTVLIPVFGKQFDQEMLFSLGLNFDADKIDVLGLVAGALPEFSDSCYALGQDNRGLINVLWMNTKSKVGISVKSNEPLFYVRANLLDANTKISEKTVSLSYDRLQNLAFNTKDSRGEAIGLEYEEAEGGNNLFSLPNESSLKSREGIHPNPFRDKLSLNIATPTGGEADLRLLSQDGRLLRTIKIEVVSGQNSININQLEALPSGVVLYQLVLPGRVISGKLIKE